MKSHWTILRGEDQHPPVEMRFIDMFMTAIGSLVFIALLLVFLLPRTTQQQYSKDTPDTAKTLEALRSENQSLREQLQKTMERWFGVVLIIKGCAPGDPELYSRWEGELEDTNTGTPISERAKEFDAADPAARTELFGSRYFTLEDEQMLKTAGLKQKIFVGTSPEGSWSVYASLRNPKLPGKAECLINPFYLDSKNTGGIIAGDPVTLTMRHPFAWLRHFTINNDGTTTLQGPPKDDKEFVDALMKFSDEQSRAVFAKFGGCGTSDAYLAQLRPEIASSSQPPPELPTGASNGQSCPNQQSEAIASTPTAPRDVKTYCVPQGPNEGSDPVTRISVVLSTGTDPILFHVSHHLLGGSVYERPRQYHIYNTQALNGGRGWQWLGQRLSDSKIWMIGELNPAGDGSYRYREWLYHDDPRAIGFEKGQSVTVARCGG